MTSFKAPMSTSYKAVFVLSILMIFVVIIGGAASGSKTSGFGIWYWGYTAWKMYKRDNDSLVSLQKIFLWFEVIAFSVGLGVLLLADADTVRIVGVSPLGFLIFAVLSMLLTYGLFLFFKNQISSDFSSTSTSTSTNTASIDDRYWEAASTELSSDRNEATWAKSFALSDGDEAKAKAMYIRNRAFDLKNRDEVTFAKVTSTDVNDANGIPSSLDSSFNNKLGLIFKLVMFIVVIVIMYFNVNGWKF